MNEAVVLSDGRVTTCCMDPLNQNIFGSIYEDSFKELERKYVDNIRRVAEDAHSLPRCSICYEKIKASGFKPGKYSVNFSEQKKKDHLEQLSSLKRMVIEPSSICNLKCNGCMQQRFDIPSYRNAPRLDMDTVFSFLEGNLGQITTIRLYNYGETFAHPESIPFIKRVKSLSSETVVHVATNGLMLDTHEKRKRLVESSVDRLTFSIHGGSQESVEPYMTKVFNFEKVMEILKDLVALKKEYNAAQPILEWKYLLFEWNDNDEEISKATTLAQQLGLDSILFFVPGYPSPSKRFMNNPEQLAKLGQVFKQG
ncbi:radical SAM protein [Salidesulfovibrio brasiliensis]